MLTFQLGDRYENRLQKKNPNKESTYESGFSLVRFPGRG